LENLGEMKDLIKDNVGGLKGLQNMIKGRDVLSLIGDATGVKKTDKSSVLNSDILKSSQHTFQTTDPEEIKSKLATMKEFSGVLDIFAPLKEKKNTKKFVKGFFIQSGGFRDTEFCNTELDSLSEGISTLPPMLEPVFHVQDPASKTKTVNGLFMLNSLVKIDHITTKTISKDKFM
jgi:hypothetical protein